MLQLPENVKTRLQQVMTEKNPHVIGEVVRGTLQTLITQENWLDVALDRVDGLEFTVPGDYTGRLAMKVVRGQVLETFTVVGQRRVPITPVRYASNPSIDVGDLEDGNVATAADMLDLARRGLANEIMADGYTLLQAAATFGNGRDNFYVIVDDGTVDANGDPTWIAKVRRQIDDVIITVGETSLSGQLKSIIARRLLAQRLIRQGGLGDINRARFELSPQLLPGDYAGVPILSLNAAKDATGNSVFPANEIYLIGAGAGVYAIPKDVRLAATRVQDLTAYWELYTERAMQLWFPELIYRIYVINTVHGKATGFHSADEYEVTVETDKYVNPASVTATSLKVYTGADPGDGVAGTALAANGVTVSPDGKKVTARFAAPLAAGTYKIRNTVALTDIGGTPFDATTDGAPIGTFTV